MKLLILMIQRGNHFMKKLNSCVYKKMKCNKNMKIRYNNWIQKLHNLSN